MYLDSMMIESMSRRKASGGREIVLSSNEIILGVLSIMPDKRARVRSSPESLLTAFSRSEYKITRASSLVVDRRCLLGAKFPLILSEKASKNFIVPGMTACLLYINYRKVPTCLHYTCSHRKKSRTSCLNLARCPVWSYAEARNL
jgi:hypothetical protein